MFSWEQHDDPSAEANEQRQSAPGLLLPLGSEPTNLLESFMLEVNPQTRHRLWNESSANVFAAQSRQNLSLVCFRALPPLYDSRWEDAQHPLSLTAYALLYILLLFVHFGLYPHNHNLSRLRMRAHFAHSHAHFLFLFLQFPYSPLFISSIIFHVCVSGPCSIFCLPLANQEQAVRDVR